MHVAIAAGCYNLAFTVFIEKYGFDLDYYEPMARMTLLHTLAKNRKNEWSPEEIGNIEKLLRMCNNLYLPNNFQRTAL